MTFKETFLTYTKITVLIIVVVLIVVLGMTGKDCIDADDFGESDIKTLYVQAQKELCKWAEDSTTDGMGDTVVESCLRKEQSESITLSSDKKCSVTIVKGSGTVANYARIKEAIKMNSLTTKFLNDNFSFSSGCGSDTMSYLREAYTIGVEKCVSTCENALINGDAGSGVNNIKDKYEPGWVSLEGINIANGTEFKVKVTGNVTLRGDKDESIEFQAGIYNLQEKVTNISAGNVSYFTLNAPIPINLKGSWVMDVDADSNDNYFGETTSTDVAKRINYLRRGIVFLRQLPSVNVNGKLVVGTIDNGSYEGPDLSMSKEYITCSYVKNLEVDYPVSCSYNDTSSLKTENIKEANNVLYALENNLSKTHAGSVIPIASVNNLKYITKNPFKSITCATAMDSYKQVPRVSCDTSVLSDTTILYNGQSKAFILDNEGSRNYNNDNYTRNINSLIYPVKIVARVVGGSGGKCRLLTKIPYEMRVDDVDINIVDESGVSGDEASGEKNYILTEIPADDKWHYITDKTLSKSPIVFGRSIYHSLKETYEGKINNTDNDYSLSFKVISPNFTDKTSWDSDTKDVFLAPINTENGILEKPLTPCGGGLVIMLMPQNDILIKESGFVSFYNPLYKNMLLCVGDMNGESCRDTTTNYPIELTYSILNPKISKFFKPLGHYVDSTLVKKENFYEDYKESCYSVNGLEVTSGDCTASNENVRNKILPSTSTLSLSKTNWSSPVYVRKGQILRFDEKSWFKIYKEEGEEGYSIEEKVFIAGNDDRGDDDPSNDLFITKSVADGLILSIEKRPALLCSGSSEEEVINSGCTIVTDENGELSCRYKFSEYCNSQSTEEGKERYCPIGCYRTFQTGNPKPNSYEDGWGIQTTVGDYIYQSFYVDPYDQRNNNCPYPFPDMPKGLQDPMSVEKCRACKNYITNSNSNKVEDPKNTLTLNQCVDLENYMGSVKILSKNRARISADVDTNASYDYDRTVFESMGLEKIQSIFNTNKDYGSLEGLSIDGTKKDGSTGNYSEYIYKSQQMLQISKPVIFQFLVLNHDNNFTNFTTKNNVGKYEISIVSPETYKNGSQLSIAIAHQDWDGADICMYKDGTQTYCVKEWLIKYDTDKSKKNSENGNYGFPDENSSLYLIDYNNGSLKNKRTKEDGYIFTGLKEGISDDTPIADGKYSELRMFFKIIDRYQYGPPAFNKGCALYKVPVMDITYSCESSAVPVELSAISCNDGGESIVGSCPVSSTNSECKKENNSYVIPPYSTTILKRCDDMYYNNTGGYTIQVKSPKNFYDRSSGSNINVLDKNYMSNYLARLSGFTIKRALVPMIEIMEGKVSGLATDPIDGEFLPCDDNGMNGKCMRFNPLTNNYDSTFAQSCVVGETNCWKTCATLDYNDPSYSSRCYKVSDNGGFVKMFYNIIITDRTYQVVVKLLFTLMIMFWGLGHLLGLTEIKHEEAIKRITKIGIIYLFIGDFGWYYYNKFFVSFFRDGVDYLVYAVASAFEPESSIVAALKRKDFYDKAILFATTDRNLSLLFSTEVSNKIMGLLWTGYMGWLYVLLIFSAILNYVFASFYALVTYMASNFFMSLALSFGPIVFALLIFEKTKSMFDKWLGILIGHMVEQVSLLACLSLFNSLIYNIIKFVLSYRVCWMPVWIVNLPIVGTVKLFSYWRVANGRITELAAESALPGLFQIMMIYCIAEVMNQFIKWASNFGDSLAGSGMSITDFTEGADGSGFMGKGGVGGLKDTIKKGVESGLTTMRDKVAGRLGYKTEEEEKTENKDRDDAIKTDRKAKKEAEKERDKLIESGVTDKDKLDEAYKETYNKNIDSKTKQTLEKNGINPETAYRSNVQSKLASRNTDSLIGAAASRIWSRMTAGDAGSKADGSSKRNVDRVSKLSKNKDAAKQYEESATEARKGLNEAKNDPKSTSFSAIGDDGKPKGKGTSFANAVNRTAADERKQLVTKTLQEKGMITSNRTVDDYAKNKGISVEDASKIALKKMSKGDKVKYRSATENAKFNIEQQFLKNKWKK
jgi:type IV secretory pathway VirB6-like protein